MTLTIIAYMPSMHGPWYFDDFPGIVYNLDAQNIGYGIENILSSRGPAQLSFALNSTLFGPETFSFHVVNLIIHLMTTCMVFLCLRKVFNSSIWWPFFGTAIFALHPLQTQAVSYIVQRSTSLSAFFLFVSLYFYISAIEQKNTGVRFGASQHLRPYIAFILTGILAIITKQNAATLPILLLLFDFFYLEKEGFKLKQKLLYVSPLFLPTLILATNMVIVPLIDGSEWRNISNFETVRIGEETTPLTYLATELSVFWLYLKLLVLPVHQVLDYGYPVVKNIFNIKTMLSLSGIILLFLLAFKKKKGRPIFLFFLLWFTVSLLVESSIIPLDPMFEHRLYVPMFGFAILVATLLKQRSETYPPLKTVVPILILTALFALSLNRNYDWATPTELYAQDAQYGYSSYRSQIMHADTLYKNGRKEEAKLVYDRVSMLIEKEGLDQASINMLVNIAISYGRYNDFLQAEKLLRMALKKSELSPGAHYNLGIALHLQRKDREALKHFAIAREMQPANQNALFYYIFISSKLKIARDYTALISELSRQDPALADKLRKQISQPSY